MTSTLLPCARPTTRFLLLVQSHPLLSTRDCTAFVADLSTGQLPDPDPIPDGSVHLCTLIFVLSALPPERVPDTLALLHRKLSPGGSLCLRDYMRLDLRQDRFLGADGREGTSQDSQPTRHLEDHLFYRGDGTLVNFFDPGCVCVSLSHSLPFCALPVCVLSLWCWLSNQERACTPSQTSWHPSYRQQGSKWWRSSVWSAKSPTIRPAVESRMGSLVQAHVHMCTHT